MSSGGVVEIRSTGCQMYVRLLECSLTVTGFLQVGGHVERMLCTEDGSEREVSEVVSWMMVLEQGLG